MADGVCVTGRQAHHKTNIGNCPQCFKTFCITCFWGCPGCGFGKGMDRRAFKRARVDASVKLTEGGQDGGTGGVDG